MKPTIFLNGLIFSNGFRYKGCVVVENGLIRSVDAGYVAAGDVDRENYDVVDCEGKMILPGVIDEHVHFRDPGLTEKGDIATESRAAVAGGVTSYFDMPNTSPQTTTIEAWEEKMARAAACAFSASSVPWRCRRRITDFSWVLRATTSTRYFRPTIRASRV